MLRDVYRAIHGNDNVGVVGRDAKTCHQYEHIVGKALVELIDALPSPANSQRTIKRRQEILVMCEYIKLYVC